jgi:hypothetical protein
MTQMQARVAPATDPTTADDTPRIDLGDVASESSAESIAHENEIVEHIAHEHDFPDQPCAHSVDEQLAGLVDAEVIRSH